MNNLKEIDRDLLRQIRRTIEQQANLDNPKNWTQQDFEFLIYFIEQQTGNRLGLTTLKRIWRNDFQRLPHLATLDILAQLAFGKNWQALKLDRVASTTPQLSATDALPLSKQFRNFRLPLITMIGLLVILLMIGAIWKLDRQATTLKKPIELDVSSVKFSAQKTVVEKVPNTVLFAFDLSNITADSFFLQQSWDVRRKIQLQENQQLQTDIYYLPGYYQAKLMANEQIIKSIPVHITSPDWHIGIDQPKTGINQPIPKSLATTTDFLAVSPSALEKIGVNLASPFTMGFYQAQAFGVTDTAFDFSLRLKITDLPSVLCPKVSLLLKGDLDYYWIMLTNKGCESEIGLKMSEYFLDGKTNDLSAFGTTLSEWQHLRVAVKNQTIHVYLQDHLLIDTTYQKSIGALKETTVLFEGIGQIDDVVLKNDSARVIFMDEF